MSAKVATQYRVNWSDPIRMWKSSFKSALFAYGLPLEDILVDEPDLTVISKEHLMLILEKMQGDLPDHMVSQQMSVRQSAQALAYILSVCDPSLNEVRIKWDQ